MGYGDRGYGGDNRSGGGGDRGGGGGGRWERERGSYGSWGSERDRDRSGGGDRHRGDQDSDDRGFIDRAGDEVRSWFGDDDAQRRREMDERRWERERGMTGDRDNDWRDRQSFGGGFGNQRGWEDHHFDRGSERGRGDEGSGRYAGRGHEAGGGADLRNAENNQRGNSQGGYQGQRGHQGDQDGYGRGGHDQHGGRRSFGGQGGYGAGMHDPHYSEHRQRQIEQLDRDYDEYRREHQSRFEQEFSGWREKRQTQRQHMSRITENMEVVGSDGELVGTVDKVRDDRIILNRKDASAGGEHHSIPCSWIENVADRVTVNKTAQEAIAGWRNEDHSRALFERDDQGSGGPHMLNRSFSGTYKDEDK